MSKKIPVIALILFACDSGGIDVENTAGPEVSIDGDCATAPNGKITVVNAWVRAIGDTSTTSAAYFTICNQMGRAVSLISVEVDLANSTLHETSRNDEGVVSMSSLQGITVPAGGRTTLRPGGIHVMLMGLTKPVVIGDLIALTLKFDDSSVVFTEAEAISSTAAARRNNR